MNPYPRGDNRRGPWLLGFLESAGCIGMTYDDDPESPRSVAYDEGRTAGEHSWPYRGWSIEPGSHPQIHSEDHDGE